MNQIYMKAEKTIIAATGEDSHHGLPGIRGTLRKPQPSLKSGKHTLISTLPHPATTIGYSKWATRGWTYQEVIFSRKRLVFTDRQVFFECNTGHCPESLQVIVPSNNMLDEEPLMCKDGAFFYKTPEAHPLSIMLYVSNFSKRELTFPEDRLNAIAGIFRVAEESENPVYQIKGVPLLPPDWLPPYIREFDYVMIQPTPKECFLVGLTWYHSAPDRETAGNQASWTWAGWNGQVSDYLLGVPDRETSSNQQYSQLSQVDVFLEIQAGEPLYFHRWRELS